VGIISLLSSSVLDFFECESPVYAAFLFVDQLGPPTARLLMEPNSLVILSGPAFYRWYLHSHLYSPSIVQFRILWNSARLIFNFCARLNILTKQTQSMHGIPPEETSKIGATINNLSMTDYHATDLSDPIEIPKLKRISIPIWSHVTLPLRA
jgi:hypothetical protein